ncbi:MAG: SpoIIIAH-like family protein [Paraclostridium sp.]
MKFNKSVFKSRGFVVMSLTLMLVVVGTVNYQLSKKSVIDTAKEMERYKEAQLAKNDDKKDTEVVDSKETKVDEKVKETSKEIKEKITSEKNMKKASYVLDMKMNREKQRNQLTEDLNEIINNPSTAEETRKQASNMKLQLVKDQELELKIEDLLGAKGFNDSLVYISEESVNVVVNEEEKLEKEDAAKIFDLVASEANIKHENIKVMNNNVN